MKLPLLCKFGLGNMLLFWCLTWSDSFEKFHVEIIYLKDIFKYDGYPHDFIDFLIKRFFGKLFVTKKISNIVDKTQMLVLSFLINYFMMLVSDCKLA